MNFQFSRQRIALCALSAVTACAAMSMTSAPAGAAVGGGALLTIFARTDAVEAAGYKPNDAITVDVIRNGVNIGTGSGPTDSAGNFTLNVVGVPGLCWTNTTPDILPGDTISVTSQGGSVVDTMVVQNMQMTTPAAKVGNVVTVHGTALDATGAIPPVTALDVRLINKAFQNTVHRNRAEVSGTNGLDGTIAYDAAGSNAWTATFNLSPADINTALSTSTLNEAVLQFPAGAVVPNEVSIDEMSGNGSRPLGGPQTPCTAPAASFGVTASTPTKINAANVASGLVLNGAAQNATAVTATLTDASGAVQSATGTLSAAAGAQTWSAPFTAAQLNALADGTLTAAASFTTAAGTVGGSTLAIAKDTVVPAAPTANPGTGNYTAAQSVSLFDTDATSVLHYTLDGTTPTATSATYTSGSQISIPFGTTTLQATAIDAAGNASPVSTFTYTITKPAPPAPAPAPAPQASSPVGGYRLIAADGGVFTFGDAGFFGSLGGLRLNAPVITSVATPSGNGYWMVASDGGIFTFGDARFFGSTGNLRLNQPIVGMVPTVTGNGYWLVARDGGIFTFGDAVFHGSTGGLRLNQPIVGMARTATGNGYWLVASDGGIFSFGDAPFLGSTGGLRLNQPIIGMARTATGNGYWLFARDGGLFTFGDAAFYGSTGGHPLNRPIVGMMRTASGNGYWLIASDGGVFTFGDAPFFGSTGGQPLNAAIVGLV